MKTLKIISVIVILCIPSFGFADEYVLIMSKDDNLCKHMQKIYNDDLKIYGSVQYKQHSEFNWITWMNKKIRLRPAAYPNAVWDKDANIALFDINNDSQEELIVYSEGMLSNYEVYIYDIFPSEYLTALDEIIDGKEYYSNTLRNLNSNDGTPHNVFDITEEGLKIIPKRMRSFVDSTKARGDTDTYFVGSRQNINFVKFNDLFYIEFEGPRGVGPNEKSSSVEHYCILSEYKQDNTLNNQCLYLIKKSINKEGGDE